TTLRAAQRHGIPMVIVPTDLDFSHFAQMIRDPGNKFKVLLPFAHTRDQVAHLPESAVAVTGYPVRRAFTTDGGHEEAPILRELGIEADHKVAMIMMGARGSAEDAVVADAEALASSLPELTEDITHVTVMCGSNETLR